MCVLKTIARTCCELDSEPLQAVYPGDELEAVEVRETDAGAVRVGDGDDLACHYIVSFFPKSDFLLQ